MIYFLWKEGLLNKIMIKIKIFIFERTYEEKRIDAKSMDQIER